MSPVVRIVWLWLVVCPIAAMAQSGYYIPCNLQSGNRTELVYDAVTGASRCACANGYTDSEHEACIIPPPRLPTTLSSTGDASTGVVDLEEPLPPRPTRGDDAPSTHHTAVIIGCSVGAGCLLVVLAVAIYKRPVHRTVRTTLFAPGLASIAPADVVVSLKPDVAVAAQPVTVDALPAAAVGPVVIHMPSPCYGHPEGHAFRRRWGWLSWTCCLCGCCMCALAHRKRICKNCGHRSDA